MKMLLYVAILMAALSSKTHSQTIESIKNGGGQSFYTIPGFEGIKGTPIEHPEPILQGEAVGDIRNWDFLQSNGIPKGISRKEVETAVQNFTDSTHGKGFRHLGDRVDFNHGHWLFAKGKYEKPVAILFHTQEHSSHWSKADPGGKYDYLDRKGRNWIYWLDSAKTENAAKYERTTYPDTGVYAETERRKARAAKARAWLKDPKRTVGNKNFTIHAWMLDPEKTGFDIEEHFTFDTYEHGHSGQFTFKRANCKFLGGATDDQNVLRIKLPAKQKDGPREQVCLIVHYN